jgi:putative endonuclease
MNAVNIGRIGESIVVCELESSGYTVLERNFRCQRGEVDIIALDAETLVVIEVKTWSVNRIDGLEYAMSSKKQASIIRTTRQFIREHPEFRSHDVRFDVVFLVPGTCEFTHLKHAFTEMNSVW